MNNFTIKIGGSQVTAAFPLTYAELLDERLDEAQITFFSRTKFYKPTTLVEIEITTGGITEVERYVVANDYSVEYPVGSGKWKHTTYLIEETKLADGILCSSLTFTNALDINYEEFADHNPIRTRVIPRIDGEDAPSFVSTDWIHGPTISAEDYEVTNIDIIGRSFVECIKKDGTAPAGFTPIYIADSDGYPTIPHTRVYIDGELVIKTEEKGFSIPKTLFNEKKSIEIVYQLTLCMLFWDLTSNYYTYPTVSYTIGIVANRMPLKKWTIADVADRVLECAEPLFGSGENAVPRYRMSDAFLNKYKNVLAPEFSMTQCTLREQLKVIGGFIHGEPYLENGVWDFLPLGDNAEADVSGGKLVHRKYAYDINSYCTEVRSNAQNLVSSLSFAKGVIADPGRSLARSIRTDQVNVRVTADNGYAPSQHPIYSISRVLCGIRATEGTYWKFGGKMYDITRFVYEANDYNAQLSSTTDVYPYSKAYGIYYTQGQKGIRGLFFRDPDSISTSLFSNYAIVNILAAVSGYPIGDIKKYIETDGDGHYDQISFRIEYRPIYSAFVSHGKGEYTEESQPYMMLYNQNENLTETSYFGENIKGVAARLGNVDQERTYIFPDRSKVPRCGTMLDGYCISAVSTQIMPSFVKCTLGLTKDFNRISEYVGISSVKRMYEVSERQTYQREIHIKETVVISTEEGSSGKNLLSLDLFDSMQAFMPGRNSDKLPVTSASVKTAYAPDSKGSYKTIDTAILPCAVTPLGNSIAFSFGFEDNYSAGQTTYYKDNKDGSNITGRFQFSHPYCDYYGRVYFLAAMLGSAKADNPSLATSIPDDQGAFYNNADNFDSSLFINHHRVRKDSREILSYTVEIEYKSANPDIYIGSEFPKRTNYVADSGEECSLTCYFTNQDISKLDSVFRPTSEDLKVEPYIRIPYKNRVEINFNVIDTSLNADIFYAHKYFVLCNPIKVTETVVSNEAGSEETVTEWSGGDVVLSGKTSAISTNSGFCYLTLYFSTK